MMLPNSARIPATYLCRFTSALLLYFGSGCTLFHPGYYYNYQPTIADRAREDKIILNGERKDTPKKADGLQITDVDVFTFLQDLRQAWRQRSESARWGGALGGVSSVGLAAAATTAAATHGGSTAGNTVPILTGIGTFIGGLLGLVDPSGRDEAYKDGMRLLLDAEAEYCGKLVIKTKACTVNGKEMTPEGATLLKRVNAAIVVVDKALEGRVPTKAEIDAATANGGDDGAEAKPVPPPPKPAAPLKPAPPSPGANP